MFNEEYFAEFFARKGYRIIYPELLDLEDQIRLIHGADEIAAVLGSLTHWALFCRPGTKFTMLTRTDNDTLYPQCVINDARDLDWYIVDVSMNFLSQHRFAEPFLMGETKYWKQYVADMYGETVTSQTWRNVLPAYIQDWCTRHNREQSTTELINIINRSSELFARAR